MSLCLAWQVADKHCLVIGAGDVAVSRINHLITANAKITVITGDGDIHPDFELLRGKLHKVVQRPYQLGDLTMYEDGIEFGEDIDDLDYEKIDKYIHENRFEVVCCCIDDHKLSTKIYYQCKVAGLNANIADKPKLCDFYFGSMINKESLQIMVSTNGKSPRLLKLIKDNILKSLDGDANHAIENLNAVRAKLRQKLLEDDVKTIELRMTWIKKLTDFFSIKQWGDIDIDDSTAEKIVGYYPEYPPRDYEEFKQLL